MDPVTLAIRFIPRSAPLPALLLLASGACAHAPQRTPEAATTTAAGPSPVFAYWHAWTDANGVSHMAKCRITEFNLKSMSMPADPQWQARQPRVEAQVLFTVQPAGWRGAWHENPKVQWIIPLAGTWFVEAMDGSRVEMGPGEVSLGEDLNTKEDARGHRGHLSGNVGSGSVTLMIVQLAEEPTLNRPCRFR